jgi:hypothetical protein
MEDEVTVDLVRIADRELEPAGRNTDSHALADKDPAGG